MLTFWKCPYLCTGYEGIYAGRGVQKCSGKCLNSPRLYVSVSLRCKR